MSKCSWCKEDKADEEFYFDKRRGKPRSQCKKCSNGLRWRRPYHYMFYAARTRARRQGLEFNLTIEDIEALVESQEDRCALTGWKLNWAGEYTGHQRVAPPDRASLDQIRPGEGYVRGNVQLLADAVNRMKNAYPEEVFLQMCRDVVLYRLS